MRIVCISDTHEQHEEIILPKGDMIIHAGDCTGLGTQMALRRFLDWYANLDFEYKILIAGNHDFLFERDPELARKCIPDNVIYLEESGTEIEGIKIWGTPVTLDFHNWAFNYKAGSDIQERFDKMPSDIDILVSHGPPKGILDLNVYGQHCGSIELLKRLMVTKPKYVVMGHIHESYGQRKVDGTNYINASQLNGHYQVTNDPIVFDF